MHCNNIFDHELTLVVLSGWPDVVEQFGVTDGDQTCEDAYISFEKDNERFRYKLGLSRKTSLPDYCIFIDHFASALIGVQAWTTRRKVESPHKILTVSDEAFLLTVIDGNYERWMHNLDAKVSLDYAYGQHNVMALIRTSRHAGRTSASKF